MLLPIYYAVPSHPHHRPYRRVEDLGLYVEDFAISPKPIHAIYNLDKSDSGADVNIVELKGMKKVQGLA